MKGQSRRQHQNIWMLLLFLLAGVVIGGFMGEVLGKIPALSWFSYGKTFGISSPVILELGVLTLHLGLQIRFTIAGILGIVLAFFLYRKLEK